MIFMALSVSFVSFNTVSFSLRYTIEIKLFLNSELFIISSISGKIFGKLEVRVS